MPAVRRSSRARSASPAPEPRVPKPRGKKAAVAQGGASEAWKSVLSVYETALAFLWQYTSGLNTLCVGPVGYILLVVACIWCFSAYVNTKSQVFLNRAVRIRYAIKCCNLRAEHHSIDVWMVNTLFLAKRENWEDLQLGLIVFVAGFSVAHSRGYPCVASAAMIACVIWMGLMRSACITEMDFLNGTEIECPTSVGNVFWEWWPLEKQEFVQQIHTQDKQSTFWGVLSTILIN